MSKTIFYLNTCSTCKRIMKELQVDDTWEQREIKTEAITPDELQRMVDLKGSYEELFSRRAMKYRSMGLNEMELTEEDYKKFILEEYTFLKRPVVILDDKIFVGNAKKEIAAAQKALGLD